MLYLEGNWTVLETIFEFPLLVRTPFEIFNTL